MRSYIFAPLLLLLSSMCTHATIINITNDCSFTVWAAALPGGGKKLSTGQSWVLNVSTGTVGRIWGRTGCNFDDAGNGSCDSGDCGGLHCNYSSYLPPVTLAEFSVNGTSILDYFDISLVDGFNLPMEFSPTSPQCKQGAKCLANINDDCPSELRVAGGCISACMAFNTDGYCCRSNNGTPSTCEPTFYSRFFKSRCPDASSYGFDNTSTFECPAGTNYKVVFCPKPPADAAATRFNIINNCPFVVWAAAVPGGGQALDQGETWTLYVNSDTEGRIWARTGCNFNSAGQGRCESGDCGGVLECQGNGRAPNTLAQYSLKQYLFNISLVEGFNVPMEFSPTSTEQCGRWIKCEADINKACPMELRDPGGCNNPCTVFTNDQFCCRSGICQPTSYSKFFKDLCPDVYTYPLDESPTSKFTCFNQTNYKVVFCPSNFHVQNFMQMHV